FLELDAIRTQFLTALPEFFESLVMKVSHRTCCIWEAARSPARRASRGGNPPPSQFYNCRNYRAEPKQNRGTMFVRWCSPEGSPPSPWRASSRRTDRPPSAGSTYNRRPWQSRTARQTYTEYSARGSPIVAEWRPR